MFALSFLGLSTRVAPAGNAIDEWALARPPEAPKLRATTLDARKTALVMMDFDGKSCTSEKRSRCFDAIPAVAGLLEEMRGLGFKGKKAAAFGSYGWSGEGVKFLSERLREAGFEIVHEGLREMWQPDGTSLERCRAFGRELASRLA